MLEIFGVSTLAVAIAEIGDKTQLLAILLAARFRRPFTILGGILVATLLNHAAAAALGYVLAQWLESAAFQIAVGGSFIMMALWTLVPDKPCELGAGRSPRSVFLTTLILFFLVEIGDKTQVATSLLAARFSNIWIVTLGTTFGMLLTNAPAVWLGEAATRALPIRSMRLAAAALFAALGVWIVVTALSR
ncbi:MAG: TMEM165/GDT1 family protein [Hyphomonadaceae bacterium]